MSDKSPVYLLAGGRPANPRTPDPLIQAVFRKSGKTSPAIACIGAANGDNQEFFSRMARAFSEAGASRTIHAIVSPEGADLSAARRILESADIIFMSGGDVEMGMRLLKNRNMVEFLTILYEGGKLFFGSSAGAIMLAKEWVCWRDPDDSSSAELFPCLGLAPVICDCHDEKSGWEELKAALGLEEDNTTGYGLVSGTALIVFPDDTLEALGGAIHRYIRHGDSVDRMPDLLPTSCR